MFASVDPTTRPDLSPFQPLCTALRVLRRHSNFRLDLAFLSDKQLINFSAGLAKLFEVKVFQREREEGSSLGRLQDFNLNDDSDTRADTHAHVES